MRESLTDTGQAASSGSRVPQQPSGWLGDPVFGFTMLRGSDVDALTILAICLDPFRWPLQSDAPASTDGPVSYLFAASGAPDLMRQPRRQFLAIDPHCIWPGLHFNGS